jgi:hypothetical protein
MEQGRYRLDEEEKQAIFGRGLTGDKFYNVSASHMENCMIMPRCRLVYNFYGSKLLNAHLTNCEASCPQHLTIGLWRSRKYPFPNC